MPVPDIVNHPQRYWDEFYQALPQDFHTDPDMILLLRVLPDQKETKHLLYLVFFVYKNWILKEKTNHPDQWRNLTERQIENRFEQWPDFPPESYRVYTRQNKTVYRRILDNAVATRFWTSLRDNQNYNLPPIRRNISVYALEKKILNRDQYPCLSRSQRLINRKFSDAQFEQRKNDPNYDFPIRYRASKSNPVYLPIKLKQNEIDTMDQLSMLDEFLNFYMYDRNGAFNNKFVVSTFYCKDCKKRTTFYPYCKYHARVHGFQLVVTDAPGYRNQLFLATTRIFPVNAPVCPFVTQVIETTEYSQRFSFPNPPLVYVFNVSDNANRWVIDNQLVRSFASHVCKTNNPAYVNTRIQYDANLNLFWLETTKAVKENQVLFLYGGNAGLTNHLHFTVPRLVPGNDNSMNNLKTAFRNFKNQIRYNQGVTRQGNFLYLNVDDQFPFIRRGGLAGGAPPPPPPGPPPGPPPSPPGPPPGPPPAPPRQRINTDDGQWMNDGNDGNDGNAGGGRVLNRLRRYQRPPSPPPTPPQDQPDNSDDFDTDFVPAPVAAPLPAPSPISAPAPAPTQLAADVATTAAAVATSAAQAAATAAALAVTAAPPSASPQRKRARMSRELQSLTPEPGWNFLKESIQDFFNASSSDESSDEDNQPNQAAGKSDRDVALDLAVEFVNQKREEFLEKRKQDEAKRKQDAAERKNERLRVNQYILDQTSQGPRYYVLESVPGKPGRVRREVTKEEYDARNVILQSVLQAKPDEKKRRAEKAKETRKKNKESKEYTRRQDIALQAQLLENRRLEEEERRKKDHLDRTRRK